MKAKFKPFGNFILVDPVKVDNKTEGGIYVSEGAIEKSKYGKVLAIGDGIYTSDGKLLPMRVNIGDMVLFNPYSIIEVKIEKASYFLLRESDLLGFLSD